MGPAEGEGTQRCTFGTFGTSHSALLPELTHQTVHSVVTKSLPVDLEAGRGGAEAQRGVVTGQGHRAGQQRGHAGRLESRALLGSLSPWA